MKVTVSFSTIKIVVPCGDGELSVRELTQLATTRYKKATGKARQSWVSVHSLKAKEGGILDPDDRLVDVCDDREQLIAFYDEEGIPQGGDGMSASSDESESNSGLGKNDIEVYSDGSRGPLQVRRGSEPALNRITGAEPQNHEYYDDHAKRWSAAVMSRDVRSSKNDLSVIDEASFYSEYNPDPGGKLSPLPPPFERGRGSGAARDSDRPTPFTRDSNRLSIQIGYEEGKWLEAAEMAAASSQGSHVKSTSSLQSQGKSTTSLQSQVNRRQGSMDSGSSLQSRDNRRQSSIDAKIEMFENASQRREPLGGTSPPQPSKPSQDDLTKIVIQNEIGPLGIHVVPSGDPVNPGLVIQGIEPGGRIDRDGRLAVHHRITEINGYNLTDLPFNKAQEIFKDALFAKNLELVVAKSSEEFVQDKDKISNNDYFMSDENKENIDNNENDGIGTLGRKYAPGSKLTSAVQAANTRKIGRKITINLVKGVHGLGFSITTRDIQSGGVTPVYIKHILPKGAAIENGELKPGDRLLEINGVSVDGNSQSEVVAILRNIPSQGAVNLVVSRQEKVEQIEQTETIDRKEIAGRQSLNTLPRINVTDEKDSSSKSSTVPNSEESEDFSSISPDLQMNHNGDVVFPWKHREILTLDIPVHDTERAGLGVSVKGKTTGGGAKGIVDLGIFVKNVIHGGAASRDGRLKTNDQLVNINGISLLGKANCDAMDTLRRAMHEEGPTPGVITLTIARRLNVGTETPARFKATGRESVTSMMTSSSGDDSYREYRIGQETLNKTPHNNSSLTDTSTSSQNNTVIYVEKPNPAPVFDNFIAPAVPRNPVVDRLMGRKEKQTDTGLRNESYYRATGHDTWNATMLQQMDTTDNGALKSPTVHQVPGETVMIEQYVEGGKLNQRHGNRPHSPDGCEGASEKDSDTTMTDVAYASQTSLEEASFAFKRDMPGRQSMSEKRHATLDAKSTDTYQRSKRARQEREKEPGDKGPIGPMLGMKKSSSLESLQTMMTEMKMESGKQATRVKTSRVVRGRGCNESFRAAVDRSYEAQDNEEAPEPDELETFDRAEYRQSGSSLDSNNDKKKKNQKLFKGFGMFKFGKQRAKSSDAMRSSGRKTPSGQDSSRQTPTDELDRRDDEAREKMVHEQAKIQQHYQRLLQQRQHSEVAEKQQRRPEERSEAVYSGEPALPASLVAARPGSRSGISGSTSDPRFANYDEIQRHLNRRQAQYHSQRREHPLRSERPVSNFYEYESIQSAMHGRQHSGGGGAMLPPRTEFSPPRNSGRRQQTKRTHLNNDGPPLVVAPLPTKYKPGPGARDYEDPRGEMEDPYARVLYAQDRVRNQRFQNSHSASRLQSHQVPKQNIYVPSLPPGSKV